MTLPTSDKPEDMTPVTAAMLEVLRLIYALQKDMSDSQREELYNLLILALSL